MPTRVVRIIGVVMTICGAAMAFIAGSSGARLKSKLHPYAYSGTKTASGESANPGGLTAAHQPGTLVRVTNRQWA